MVKKHTKHPTKRRLPKDYAKLVVKGFAMGASDVVPGVSGGTMAFILGIYEELIQSIRSITQKPFIDAVLSLDIKKAFYNANAPFLIAVLSGIVLAILTLAHSLEYALESMPELVWSFFFGLVVASILVIRKRIPSWTPTRLAALLIGGIAAYTIVGLVPVNTPESWWFLILSGALAICAMILPGISGAFILVLLGKYEFALQAVNNHDIMSLALIAFGCLIGLLSFAQILGWLFKHHHDATVATLIGFMIGSLRKIWPWKQEIGTTTINVLPDATSHMLSAAYLISALSFMLVGFCVILLIEALSERKHAKRKK